jgi:hypothetical protein
MTCDHCSEPAVVFAPGTEEIRELFLIVREQPVHCWCLKHWLAEFGRAEKERLA